MARIIALLLVIAGLPAMAQFFPFPGPGRSSVSGGVLAPTLTYITGCAGSASDAVANCALTSVAAGDLIIVKSKTDGPGATLAVSTSVGTACTWTAASTVIHYNVEYTTASLGAYTCIAAADGNQTVQALWSGGRGVFSDITVGVYRTSTSWKSPVLDSVTGNTASSDTATATAAVGPTSTTSNTNDLVVGICDQWNVGETWTSVSGWTNRAGSSRNTSGWYDRTVTGTGTQSFSVAISADEWGCLLMPLKSN